MHSQNRTDHCFHFNILNSIEITFSAISWIFIENPD